MRVSPSFGVRWLGPRIAAFSTANPDWNIRVDATPDFSSFETEAVDLDLRYGSGGWSGLSETPVMNDLVLPLCSPGHLEDLRRVSDDPAEQLRHAKLIDSVKMLYRWDLWLAANRISVPEPDYRFRFDRSSMSIETAKQGAGIALDSVTLCLPELERGELVFFSAAPEAVEFQAYWLVCPNRHHSRRIVRRFSDWLTDAASEHQERARAVLTELGCTFRTVSASDLIGVETRTSQ